MRKNKLEDGKMIKGVGDFLRFVIRTEMSTYKYILRTTLCSLFPSTYHRIINMIFGMIHHHSRLKIIQKNLCLN